MSSPFIILQCHRSVFRVHASTDPQLYCTHRHDVTILTPPTQARELEAAEAAVQRALAAARERLQRGGVRDGGWMGRGTEDARETPSNCISLSLSLSLSFFLSFFLSLFLSYSSLLSLTNTLFFIISLLLRFIFALFALLFSLNHCFLLSFLSSPHPVCPDRPVPAAADPFADVGRRGGERERGKRRGEKEEK